MSDSRINSRTLAVNLAAGRDDLSWRDTARRYHDLAQTLEAELTQANERANMLSRQLDDALITAARLAANALESAKEST